MGKKHIVKQGDSIYSIAVKHAVNAEEIWKANETSLTENDKKRAKTILYPGTAEYKKINIGHEYYYDNYNQKPDEIDIPKSNEKNNSGNVSAQGGDSIVGKISKYPIKLIIKDDGNEYSNEPFELKVYNKDGKEMSPEPGVTKESGEVKIKDIWHKIDLNTASYAILKIGKMEEDKEKKDNQSDKKKNAEKEYKYEFELLFNWLDPVTTISGIQARLNNLGFESGPVDNILGPITDGAIRQFQKTYELAMEEKGNLKENIKDSFNKVCGEEKKEFITELINRYGC